MAAGTFVAYYRVSTQKQGRSGLGLDAQRAAVRDFLNGGNWELIGEYTEVESGKRHDNRPELEKAMRHAKATGSRLVIAKLDRLSRNAAFLLTLRDSGVDFVAADMPEANATVVGIMAVLAQDERERTSARTKAALAICKERGTKLGNPNGTAHILAQGLHKVGAARGVATIKRDANNRAQTVASFIDQIRQNCPDISLHGIADELNAMHVQTARGGKWTSVQVGRVLNRVKNCTD